MNSDPPFPPSPPSPPGLPWGPRQSRPVDPLGPTMHGAQPHTGPAVLGLDGNTFTDPHTLADAVRAQPSIAQSALTAAADGRLTQWLAALGDRGDPLWHLALTDPRSLHYGTAYGFWSGIYRNASDRSLRLATDGVTAAVGSWRTLLQATFAAQHWPSLKALRVSGELVAFLCSPPTEPIALERLAVYSPAEPVEVSLNKLLWSLGATGLVLDWGGRGQPVSTPGELAGLYAQDPLQLDRELSKGYPFTWLAPRLGSPVQQLIFTFIQRVMLGRAPAGHLSAAVTTLVRPELSLALDPCRPRDQQVSRVVPPKDPTAAQWSLLLPLLHSGLGGCWLASQLPPSAQPPVTTLLQQWSSTGLAPTANDWLTVLTPVGAPSLSPTTSAPQQQYFPPPIAPPPQFPQQQQPLAPKTPAGRNPLAAITVIATVALSVVAVFVVFQRLRSRSPDPPENTPRPDVLAPRSAPSAPAPTFQCAITSQRSQIGTYGSASPGIVLSRHADTLGAAWVVAGLDSRTGADDAAGVILSRDGRLVRVVDPETPDDTAYPGYSPHEIGNATVVWSFNGTPSVIADEAIATPDTETIRCANLTARWPVRRNLDPFGNPIANPPPAFSFGFTPPWTPELLQPYSCRTLAPDAPIILGQRLYPESHGEPRAHTSIFSSPLSGEPINTLLQPSLSRTLLRSIPSANDPRRLLRAQGGTDWHASFSYGHGYSVIWRDDETLHGLWLDTSLHLVGSPWQLATNDRHSAPAVRLDGTDGLIVFATHQLPGDRHNPSPFRLATIRLRFGESPTAFTWLTGLTDDPRYDYIAPSIAALPDRRWAVTYTSRPARDRASLPPADRDDSVYLLPLAPSLSPLGTPFLIASNQRDAEVAAIDSHLVVVSLSSSGSRRSRIFSYGLQCSPR